MQATTPYSATGYDHSPEPGKPGHALLFSGGSMVSDANHIVGVDCASAISSALGTIRRVWESAALPLLLILAPG